MATKRLEVYKCKHCGNVVEVLVAAGGTLSCCGEPMELLVEKTADFKTEKHVPVVAAIDGGYEVKVGSVPHPMTEAHQIAWIELLADGAVMRQYLEPGQAPAAVFKTDAQSVSAREFCNLHGLWKG